MKKIIEEKTLLQYLQELDFFKVFTRDEVEELLWAGEWTKVKPEEVIIQEGEVDVYLYVMIQGEASVILADRVLAVLQPGETFGEFGLMGVKRTAHVVAKTECLLLGFSADRLNLIHTDIQLKLLKQLLFTLLARLSKVDRKAWYHHTARWT